MKSKLDYFIEDYLILGTITYTKQLLDSEKQAIKRSYGIQLVEADKWYPSSNYAVSVEQ